MSYFLPTVIWVALSKKPWHACENLMPILFFGTLIAVGLGSVVITILSAGYEDGIMPRHIVG